MANTGCFVFSFRPRSPLEGCNRRSTFSVGLTLHNLLHSGRSANTLAKLSSSWVGGHILTRKPSALGTGLPSSYKIPRLEKNVQFAGQDPRFLDRMCPQEANAEPAKYAASQEAMASICGMFTMGRSVLHKRVKKWSLENLSLTAVGAAHNYSIIGDIRISESVVQMDESIPDVEA